MAVETSIDRHLLSFNVAESSEFGMLGKVGIGEDIENQLRWLVYGVFPLDFPLIIKG